MAEDGTGDVVQGQMAHRLEDRNGAFFLVDPSGAETAVPLWALCRAAVDFEAQRAGPDSVLAKLLETPLGWEHDGDDAVALTLGGTRVVHGWDEVCAEAGTSDHGAAIRILDNLHRPDASARNERAVPVLVSTLASKLLAALASKIGAMIGAKIFGMVFPSKEQTLATYFDDMYDRLSAMFDKKLAESKINSINGHINGTQAYIRNFYPGYHPDSSNTIPYLKNLILPFSANMYTEVTYTLERPDVREPGFVTFLLAVGVHLALLQELAVLDGHSGHQFTVDESLDVIRRQAGEYLQMTRDTWAILLQKRLSYVKVGQTWAPAFVPGGTGMFLLGYVIDEYIDKKPTLQSTSWATSSTEEFYRDQLSKLQEKKMAVTKAFSESLAGPGGVEQYCANLEELRREPLPPT